MPELAVLMITGLTPVSTESVTLSPSLLMILGLVSALIEAEPINESAMAACEYILNLSPRERLQQAGVLSGDFWLTQ